jgi:hypothetical protein
MDTGALVVDAFAQLGIDAQLLVEAHGGVELVLGPDRVGSPLQIAYRALVTDDVAKRLLGESTSTDGVLLVVGDRVTEAARRLLTAAPGGYYDLRGRLVLRTDRIVIDAEVEPVKQRAERTRALSGTAGLEVAAALLIDPERGTAVRELARELGRSPSTVSDILAALRRDGLIDGSNAVSGSDLFWQVAEGWHGPRTYLATLPNPGTDNDLSSRWGSTVPTSSTNLGGP